METMLLNQLLGNRSRVAVLRVLAATRTEITGREVARLAGVSNPQTLVALAACVKLGVIRRRQAGRAGLYVLNRSLQIVRRGLLPLFRVERDLVDHAVADFVRRLDRVAVESVTVFGSTARNSRRHDSDIDLLVVTGRRTPAGDDKILAAAEAGSRRMGVRLAPLLLTGREVRRARGQRHALLRSVAREGRTVLGRLVIPEQHG